MSRLLGLYPAAWRERYEAEVRDLLRSHPPTVRDRLDLLRGAADAWIHPQIRRRSDPSLNRQHLPALTAAATAIVGGLLFITSGWAFVSLHAIGPDGAADHTAAFVLLVGAMLVTAVAAAALAPAGGPRWAAGLMIVGALLDLLPWPILALGFLAWVLGSVAMGIALLGRGRLLGLLPIAIGFTLATLNTETDRALVAIPVGSFWIGYAVVAHLRPGASATAAPAAGGA